MNKTLKETLGFSVILLLVVFYIYTSYTDANTQGNQTLINNVKIDGIILTFTFAMFAYLYNTITSLGGLTNTFKNEVEEILIPMSALSVGAEFINNSATAFVVKETPLGIALMQNLFLCMPEIVCWFWFSGKVGQTNFKVKKKNKETGKEEEVFNWEGALSCVYPFIGGIFGTGVMAGVLLENSGYFNSGENYFMICIYGIASIFFVGRDEINIMSLMLVWTTPVIAILQAGTRIFFNGEEEKKTAKTQTTKDLKNRVETKSSKSKRNTNNNKENKKPKNNGSNLPVVTTDNINSALGKP